MNQQLASQPVRDLAARREQLLLRSAQLRERLNARASVLRPAWRAADRVRDGLRTAREHRALVLMIGTALGAALLARPRRVVGLGLKAWSGWQLVRRVRPLARAVRRWMS